MTDIVMRLRDAAHWGATGHKDRLMVQAADEIERLRLGVVELQQRIHWLNDWEEARRDG